MEARSRVVEEAARMRRFPGIGFRGADAGRRGWVIGTGLDVWQVVEVVEDLGARDRAVAETDLDELRELYPFIAVEALD